MPDRDHMYDAEDRKGRGQSNGKQFIKLVLASLLVGFVMYQSGLNPGDIFGGFGRWSVRYSLSSAPPSPQWPFGLAMVRLWFSRFGF